MYYMWVNIVLITKRFAPSQAKPGPVPPRLLLLLRLFFPLFLPLGVWTRVMGFGTGLGWGVDRGLGARGQKRTGKGARAAAVGSQGWPCSKGHFTHKIEGM